MHGHKPDLLFTRGKVRMGKSPEHKLNSSPIYNSIFSNSPNRKLNLILPKGFMQEYIKGQHKQ